MRAADYIPAPKGRPVRALFDRNLDGCKPPLFTIELTKRISQPPRLNANDRIILRIKVGRPVQSFNADRVALQTIIPPIYEGMALISR